MLFFVTRSKSEAVIQPYTSITRRHIRILHGQCLVRNKACLENHVFVANPLNPPKMIQNKCTLNDSEILRRILTLLESGNSSPPPIKNRIYNNRELMELLNIKTEYLKKLRDNGYIGYSRHGDKYWYTQEDVDRFLRRFHYSDFAPSNRLPNI